MSDVPDGRYRAVVDRIEDGLAALELTVPEKRADEDDDVETTNTDRVRKWELLVSPDELPDPAREADAVLTVIVTDGSLSAATHDPDATEDRAETARERFERLSSRPPTEADETDTDDSDPSPE